MRSFLWGMVTGACLTLLCVAGYVGIQEDTTSPTGSFTSTPAAGRNSPESGRSHGIPPDQRRRTARRGTNLHAPKTTGAGSFTPLPESSFKSIDQNPVPAGVERLAQSMGMNRFDRFRAFRGQYEALKTMGRDALPELLSILQGEGTQLSKIIAASLLGSINAELKDDEVFQILRMEGVPLLESILESDAVPLSSKRQALFALGEIGIEDAQQVLIDVLTGEQHRAVQGYALRILGNRGTIDSAMQLLSFLDTPKDETQFLMAARAIGMINRRVNDSELTLDLMRAVPNLQEIVRNETEPVRKKQSALMTLASIGNEDTTRMLLDIAAGGGGSRELQQGATFALIRAGSPEVAFETERYLENATDEDQQLRFSGVIAAIAKRNPDTAASAISESRALPALYTLASSAESPETRVRAIYVIGSVGSTDDIEYLRELGAADATLQSATGEAISRIEEGIEGLNRFGLRRLIWGMW